MALINPVPPTAEADAEHLPDAREGSRGGTLSCRSVLSLELTLAVTRGGEVGSAVHTPCTHAASPPVLSRTRIWLN